MTLSLTVDRNDNRALYHQIADQVRARIQSGQLPTGAQLPTVRQLARDAGVTRLTVQNAYAELQSDGWIEATVGRGTFVSTQIEPALWTASHGQPLTPDTVIGDILQINQAAGLRSMASASPDPTLFPAADFFASLAAQQEQASAVSTYGSSQGDPRLRLQLANELSTRGITAAPDEILVTAGVTQGLSLMAQTLARPGDAVLVEQPTYLGFLHTLRAQNLEPIGVPMDADGPILEEVERLAVQQRPRFFYTVPTYQNPTGFCTSSERRRDLLTLAEQHGFLIVEDDIYGRLALDGAEMSALKALDSQGYVVHVGSFSKMLMPGLRLGYVVAPAPLGERLLSLRRASDLCSPPLLQRALADFLARGGLQRHLQRVLPIYRERRDVAMAALARFMPSEVTWTQPSGGFCCWLTIPRHPALEDLHRQAMRAGWAFAPGEVFLVEPDEHLHLRICFGNVDTDAIRAGIARLGELIYAGLAQERPPSDFVRDWTPLV